MQNIEVSNEAYQKFMRYCAKYGENASSAIMSFVKNAEESIKMDEEYANSKPVISHKDLCKRYGLI